LGEAEISPINEYLWYRASPSANIEISIKLELREEEIAEDISAILDLLDISRKNIVKLARSIHANDSKMKWLTLEIQVDNERIYPLTSEEIEAVAQKYDEDEEQELAREALKILGESFINFFKGKFSLIPAVRDNIQPTSELGLRTTPLDKETIQKIVTLGQSTKPADRSAYGRIRRQFEIFSRGQRIDTAGNELFVTESEGDFGIPISYTGGGTQEALLLSRLIHEIPAPIIAIEEPETHLHPGLVKKLYEDFSHLADGPEAKQLFIATHSPFFLDRTKIGNLWVVRKSGFESKFEKVSKPGDFRNAFDELGINPSDLLFSDGAILVEGRSEEILFPNFARLLSSDFERKGITVIPVMGKTKTKHNLAMWSEIAKNAQIPIFIILDGNAKSEVDNAIEKGLIEPERAFTLQKNCIEAYYPSQKLTKALNELFQLGISEKEVAKILQTQNPAKELNQKLQKKDIRSWKVELAHWMSKEITASEIPTELKGILRLILRTFD
jgi:hypothetical protein